MDDLREPLRRYRVARNLPAITEINSGATPLTSRLAYVAVGEFRVPIFAPWALTVSFPESHEPYILPDGREANGASALRDPYMSLMKALPQISYYAATDKLKVFMSDLPGQRFTRSEGVNGFTTTVTGEREGQAIVIHPSGHEFLVVGYRCQVSWHDAAFIWPEMKNLNVKRVVWAGERWKSDGEASYNVDQSNKTLSVDLDSPQAVLLTW